MGRLRLTLHLTRDQLHFSEVQLRAVRYLQHLRVWVDELRPNRMLAHTLSELMASAAGVLTELRSIMSMVRIPATLLLASSHLRKVECLLSTLRLGDGEKDMLLLSALPDSIQDLKVIGHTHHALSFLATRLAPTSCLVSLEVDRLTLHLAEAVAHLPNLQKLRYRRAHV